MSDFASLASAILARMRLAQGEKMINILSGVRPPLSQQSSPKELADWRNGAETLIPFPLIDGSTLHFSTSLDRRIDKVESKREWWLTFDRLERVYIADYHALDERTALWYSRV